MHKEESSDRIFKDDPKAEGEQENIEETVELLRRYKRQFEGSLSYYSGRADRIDMLMQRRSARKWSAKKKQKMVRRLINARQTVDQLEPIIAQVNVRLEQHGAV